jgi:mRNA interferase MazF
VVEAATSSAYCPDRGDVVWLEFSPQAGREQAGHRPALVLSPRVYNAKVGLAVVCPITSRKKGYPFEVDLPAGLGVVGVVLADQVKSVDWQARQATFMCVLPDPVVNRVKMTVNRLI